MKKTRFLALALVIAIALAGAGYAAWSDTLKINAKVKTGTFDVDFVDVIEQYVDDEVVATPVIGALGGIENGKDRDKVYLQIDNMYPGAEARHKYVIKNVGSIKAIFSGLDLEADSENNSNVNLQVTQCYINGENQYVSDWIPASDGNIVFPENFVLDKDTEMEIEISFVLDYESNTEESEGQTLRYEITLNAEQANPTRYTHPEE